MNYANYIIETRRGCWLGGFKLRVFPVAYRDDQKPIYGELRNYFTKFLRRRLSRKHGKKLIVSADDFGITDVVTRAILDCYEAGLLRSKTPMVGMDVAEFAAT